MENLTKELGRMRKDKVMVDITIVSSNGSIHDVHSVVLGASSPVFKVMLTHEFQELRSKNITIPDASGEVIEAILEFIYTGNISFDNDNLMDIFELANRYEIMPLLLSCKDYITKNMDITNGLDIRRLGERYVHKDMVRVSSSFILQNFKEFSKSEDFYDLTITEFSDFLRSDELNMEREEDLLDLVSIWCHHDKAREGDLHKLLECLRYTLMKYDNLESTLSSNSIFKTDSRTYNFTKNILKYCFNKSKNIGADSNNLECLTKQHRIPPQLLLLIGGWNHGRTLDIIECYNKNSNEWVMANHFKDPAGGRCYFALGYLFNQVYVLGGYDGKVYLNNVRRFHPATGEWSDIASMHIRRCFTSAIVLNDSIYVMAGFDGTRRLTSVERYSPSKNQWSLINSINTPRSDAAAVLHDGKIYLIGGYGGDSLYSVECYNSDEDTWSFRGRMQCKRSGACAVSLPKQNKIMVLGGYNGRTRMRTTEFYDPVENSWEFGPPMQHDRSNFAACMIGDGIYVIGGYTGHRTLSQVERFDISSQKWTAVGDINCPRSAMKAVMLGNLPNISDYFKNSKSRSEVGRVAQSQHTENNLRDVPNIDGASSHQINNNSEEILQQDPLIV